VGAERQKLLNLGFPQSTELAFYSALWEIRVGEAVPLLWPVMPHRSDEVRRKSGEFFGIRRFFLYEGVE